MGRGRAKAKQTKVARRLKYYSPDTDLTALERELKGSEGDLGSPTHSRPPDEDQEQYIAEHYGRNRHRDGDDAASSTAQQGRSHDDDGTEHDSEASSASSSPAPPITPGSWMKKRA